MAIDPTTGMEMADPALAVPEMSLSAPDTTDTDGKVVDRKPPEPDEKRRALVTSWIDRVKYAREFHDPAYQRMRADMDFALGLQWSNDRKDDRYMANLTLRVVQQKTAFLYAKNPRAICKRREKILNTVWDGSQAQLQSMQQAATMAAQTGMMGDPMVAQQMPQVMAVAQDAVAVHDAQKNLDAIAKTLELLYDYNIKEQVHPFKQMMKLVVRRAVTTGVGYVKLGFQRTMEKRPEIEARLQDTNQRLATLEQLASDMADGEIDDTSAQAEQLRLLAEDLAKQVEFVSREGLIFDYPSSTAIIPDTKCVHLREFLGAEWVAQEYTLAPGDVQQIYGVDVGSEFRAYRKSHNGASDLAAETQRRMAQREGKSGVADTDMCCIWEVFSKTDGMVYHLCDGYPDFLREPAAPSVYIERFFPWFALVFNECEHEGEIFPPSDVSLVRPMQMEFNRARQGLREHRVAARPKTIVAAGMLSDSDKRKLENHPNNAVLEISGIQPGQDVKTVLQAWQGPGIDPNVYEVEQLYSDIMRVTGVQEANLGGASGGTATESQIAEASRQTSMGSNIDDLDDLLSQLARAGGQILMKEVGEETARKIVGPGAIWPTLTRQDVAEELWLETEAGSTGRPNQAQEISNYNTIAPILMQIPGLDPEFLAREGLKRLDDKLDMTQAFKPMLPSITMMNAMKFPTAPGAGPVPGDPAGAAGAASSGAPGLPGEGGSPPPDQNQMFGGQGMEDPTGGPSGQPF